MIENREERLAVIRTAPERQDDKHLLLDSGYDPDKKHGPLRWRILYNAYRWNGISFPTTCGGYMAQVETIDGTTILCGPKTRVAMLNAYNILMGHHDSLFGNTKFHVFARTPEEIVDIIEEVEAASL